MSTCLVFLKPLLLLRFSYKTMLLGLNLCTILCHSFNDLSSMVSIVNEYNHVNTFFGLERKLFCLAVNILIY